MPTLVPSRVFRLSAVRPTRGRAWLVALALSAHVGIAACEGSGGANPAETGEVVAALILGGAPNGALLVGQTVQLSATTLNASGGVVSNGQVQWSTSDPSV